MADGRVLRRNVEALSDPELEALRNAYAGMMRIADYRGYNYWAGLHGIPQYYCWHGPRPIGQIWHPSPRLDYDLWLPWHRAYLLYFEHYLRDQAPNVTLPWWDWTASRTLEEGIPAAFSDEETAGGLPNPLYKSRIRATDYVSAEIGPIDRETSRFPEDAGELRRFFGEKLEEVLAITGREDTDYVTAVRWIPQFEGSTGFSQILVKVHNEIHNWTGGLDGDMSNADTAAYDPIFWSHHCMLDRIWYLWQLENGVNNIPADYLPVVLQPFGLTVGDVLDIGALGYEYAVSDAVVGGTG